MRFKYLVTLRVKAGGVALGPALCMVHLYVLVALMLQEIFIHVEINLLCAFHLWRLRVLSLDEDFGKVLMVLVNLAVSLLVSAALCATSGEAFFSYKLCVGDCPGKTAQKTQHFCRVFSLC